MIFEKHSLEEIEYLLKFIGSQIKQGRALEQILLELPESGFHTGEGEELYSIARARIKGRRKFSHPEQWLMNLSDERFATPDFIASYRAKRLSCSTIVDLCCGIGSQSIAFAKTCGKVIAVDIDARKIEYAKHNAKMQGASNITFICADALSPEAVAGIQKADIIFCDPERLPEEKERALSRIEIIPQIIKTYLSLTPNLAFEVPPQLSPQRISYDCEKEYLSVDGELNRLTLYFSTLKKHDLSVITLPGEEHLNNDHITDVTLAESIPLSFVHEVNDAVRKAGLISCLLSELQEPIFLLKETKKRILLTSSNDISHPFLRSYAVLAQTNADNKDIIDGLQRIHAKSVVLKMEVAPEEYWKKRVELEKGLSGTENIHLFIADSLALLCRKKTN